MQFMLAQIRFSTHAVHVGTCLRGFMTLATSKTEHFMTIGNAFPKIETKHCVKILYVFLFQSNTYFLDHALFLFIHISFFKHL